MIKGYQSFAGRALIALDAVERCADALRGYKVWVYSATGNVYPRVEELRSQFQIDIAILPRSNHAEMLHHFSTARVYLGVSLSDAISTSMLEAMAMGAFPIQTNTSCCDEWIEDGKAGFHIPVDNPDVIAERLHRALVDDRLVDAAATINWPTVQSRLDQSVLKQRAVALYEGILGPRASAAPSSA